MSMKKKYPARLNVPCTQEMYNWVYEKSGGDGFMANFTRTLLLDAITNYEIHNPQKKPATFVLDTEE